MEYSTQNQLVFNTLDSKSSNCKFIPEIPTDIKISNFETNLSQNNSDVHSLENSSKVNIFDKNHFNFIQLQNQQYQDIPFDFSEIFNKNCPNDKDQSDPYLHVHFTSKKGKRNQKIYKLKKVEEFKQQIFNYGNKKLFNFCKGVYNLAEKGIKVSKEYKVEYDYYRMTQNKITIGLKKLNFFRV